MSARAHRGPCEHRPRPGFHPAAQWQMRTLRSHRQPLPTEEGGTGGCLLPAVPWKGDGSVCLGVEQAPLGPAGSEVCRDSHVLNAASFHFLVAQSRVRMRRREGDSRSTRVSVSAGAQGGTEAESTGGTALGLAPGTSNEKLRAARGAVGSTPFQTGCSGSLAGVPLT